MAEGCSLRVTIGLKNKYSGIYTQELWSRKRTLTAVGTCCTDHVTPLYAAKAGINFTDKWLLSVDIVRLRTKGHIICSRNVQKCMKVSIESIKSRYRLHAEL
jgi:hypothetical protein